MVTKVEKFEELIKDYIGPNKTIVDVKITNLMPPGENYVSQIVKIDVTLENNGTYENLYLVAKLIIDRGGRLGPTGFVTKNEIEFYTGMLPAIKQFYEKYGLPYPEFYPEYVAGRINLTGSNEADNDAVIVLKNLKIEGYENVDRHVGFDLATAKLVLTDLAAYHAIPLAMKLVEPDLYETEIKSRSLKIQSEMGKAFQIRPNVNASPNEKANIPDPSKHPSQKAESTSNDKPGSFGPPSTFRLLLQLFEQDDKYVEVAPRYKKFLDAIEEMMKGGMMVLFTSKIAEPFATLMHSDMWVNNTMQIIKDGVGIKNKLVDFQMCKLGSPAHDLIFFLFSSVELSCLKEHLDALLDHYYQEFSGILKKCGCYGPQFSYESFLEELKTGGEKGIIQALMMTPAIFGEKGQELGPDKSRTLTLETIPPMALKKLIFMCEECVKRGWF